MGGRARSLTPSVRTRLASLMVAVTVLAGLTVAVQPAAADDHEPQILPIVFAHGASGSAAQYETQAKRWASNGYPAEMIRGFEYDSGGIGGILGFGANLEAFIDDLRAEFDVDQVYLLAHSLGTALSGAFLANPARAARVAKYIAIDGSTAANCPGGVPCMGLWARGNPARAMGPNHNVQFADQGHTEVVGSAEGFKEQYRFLMGEYPQTTLVLPEDPTQVTISGRASNFPANSGLDGAAVLVWEVDGATGHRTKTDPDAVFGIGPSGNWGPVSVHGEKHYELALHRPGGRIQHFYFEPFSRSSHLVRLLASPPDSALSQAVELGPHSTASIQRQKEWWGNHPEDSDELWVSTTSASLPDQPPVNIVNGNTTPVTASTIAMITWDAGVDGVSNPNQLIPGLGAFLTGIDVYYPATNPPDGTITFEHHARGESVPQVINTANWASDALHGMTVTFNDYVQEFPEPDPELSQRILTTIDPIAAGSLVVSVDPEDRTVVMPTMELAATGDRWETSGELRPVLVTDTRFGAPGWSVSGQITPTVGQTFEGQYLGWAPKVLTQAPGQGVAPGAGVPSGFGGGDGLGVSRVLGSAPLGQGTGTATLGADLALELPTHMPSGVYSVLLTLTAI